MVHVLRGLYEPHLLAVPAEGFLSKYPLSQEAPLLGAVGPCRHLRALFLGRLRGFRRLTQLLAHSLHSLLRLLLEFLSTFRAR